MVKFETCNNLGTSVCLQNKIYKLRKYFTDISKHGGICELFWRNLTSVRSLIRAFQYHQCWNSRHRKAIYLIKMFQNKYFMHRQRRWQPYIVMNMSFQTTEYVLHYNYKLLFFSFSLVPWNMRRLAGHRVYCWIGMVWIRKYALSSKKQRMNNKPIKLWLSALMH